MIKNRTSNIFFSLALTTTLSACSDIPGIEQTLLQYRIKSVTVDLDNNGTPDGTLNYFYDSAGRLTKIDHVYTDDGVEDSSLNYLPKATLLPDYVNMDYQEIRSYNIFGWPDGSQITRTRSGSGIYLDIISEYMYGTEGINSIVTQYVNESGTLESTTTVTYLNFVNGLPEQIKYEYTPPPYEEGWFFNNANLTRNSQGRVETLFQQDEYEDLVEGANGEIEESFIIEWDDAQIASYKVNFKEFALSQDDDTTVIFEYDDNCLTKEHYKKQGTSLGYESMEEATINYTHDPATGTPLSLEIDKNSDGTVDARMDFEIEKGPYRIFTYSTLRAPDVIRYPTFQALDQSSELKHALFCTTAPSLVDTE